MNIKDAVEYLGADKELYLSTEPCEHCNRKQELFYTVGDRDNPSTMCGRCLVKHANSLKDHRDRGGI